MRPIHPGEILKEDFLASFSMSANALMCVLKVSATKNSQRDWPMEVAMPRLKTGARPAARSCGAIGCCGAAAEYATSSEQKDHGS